MKSVLLKKPVCDSEKGGRGGILTGSIQETGSELPDKRGDPGGLDPGSSGSPKSLNLFSLPVWIYLLTVPFIGLILFFQDLQAPVSNSTHSPILPPPSNTSGLELELMILQFLP